MPRPALTLPALLLVGLLLASAAASAPLQRTLPNGIRVVCERYPAAPVAAVRLYLRTGSLCEAPWTGSGVSHLVEHTVFRGTAKYTQAQIRDLQGRLGGVSNAYTGRDYTCYHLTTTADKAPQALELLADMALAPTLAEESLRQEQQIILHEMDMGQDEPGRQLYDLFFTTLFLEHPRRYPIIGYPDTFAALTPADAREYHRARYAPDNLVVSLVGDFDPAATLAQAAGVLGAYPARATRPLPLPVEPPLSASREQIREQAGLPRTWQLLGWRGVSMFSPDMYALDLLALVLGRGDSSRLVKRLRYELGLVDSVWCYSDTPAYDAGAFVLGAVAAPEKAEQVREALLAQVRRVREQLVNREELDRARRLLRADLTFGREDVASRAEELGTNLLLTGDPEFNLRYVERVARVTPEDLRQVARRYLDPAVYARAVLQPPAADSAPGGAAAGAAPVRSEMFRLPNGLRVIVTSLPGSGVLHAVTALRAGLRLEPEGKPGLSSFCASLLTRGTPGRSREEIARTLEERGARLGSYSGRNSLGLTGQALAEDRDLLLGALADCLRRPSFPPAEIEQVRTETLSALQARQESPYTVTFDLLASLLFTRHPYRWPEAGTEASVKSFTREDLVGFHAALCAPGGTVLHLAGDLPLAEARRLTEKYLGDWRATVPEPAAPAPEPPLTEQRAQTVARAQQQAVLCYGWPGPQVSGPDRYAWAVLAEVLDARSNVGLIYPPLRDAGLVYAAGAYMMPGLDPGQFVIYAATDAAKLPQVRATVEQAVTRLQTDGVAPEALREVQDSLVTSQALGLASLGGRAQTQALDELYGLGYDSYAGYPERVRAVTAADLQRVARQYLSLERCVVAITRPPEPAQP